MRIYVYEFKNPDRAAFNVFNGATALLWLFEFNAYTKNNLRFG